MEELYSKVDFVSIVSGYVQLKRNGSQYYGLCPFHHEKTPSFYVNPSQNLYYCFGCKAGGNAVQFIMEMEHLTFQEAVEYLAQRCNMTVPQASEDPEYEKRMLKSELYYRLNAEAARFYHSQLWEAKGRNVLRYLYSRGLDDATIRKFGLGASGTERDGLLRYLTAQSYDVEDIQAAGLCIRKENSSRDMFINRAMFPIIDAHGRVLGFGGRALDPDSKPKYLNTPDTLIFNKRKGVYAANLLKKISHPDHLVLVEGYLDVISLIQKGVQGVIATLGTAFTEEQARFLKRYAPEVWLAYDGDEAGQHAIEKAIPILWAGGLRGKVLIFPDNMDPDEYIRKNGKESFDQLKPIFAIAYLMLRIEKDCDLNTDEGRIQYAKNCSSLLNKLQDPVEREYYEKQIVMKTGFSQDTIREQAAYEHHGSNLRPAAKQYPVMVSQKYQSDLNQAEKILFALLAGKKLPAGLVSSEDFRQEVFKNAAKRIIAGEEIHSILSEYEDPKERQAISEAMVTVTDEEMSSAVQIAQECLNTIHRDRLMEEINQNKERLTQDCSDAERAKILENIVSLNREIAFIHSSFNDRGVAN